MIRAGAAECTPRPEISTRSANVVWKPCFILALPRRSDDLRKGRLAPFSPQSRRNFDYMDLDERPLTPRRYDTLRPAVTRFGHTRRPGCRQITFHLRSLQFDLSALFQCPKGAPSSAPRSCVRAPGAGGGDADGSEARSRLAPLKRWVVAARKPESPTGPHRWAAAEGRRRAHANRVAPGRAAAPANVARDVHIRPTELARDCAG